MRLKNRSIREQRVIKVIAEAKPKYRGILKRAFDGSGSEADAIKAMCLACTSYTRPVITGCTCFSCPLWKYRPYQKENAR